MLWYAAADCWHHEPSLSGLALLGREKMEPTHLIPSDTTPTKSLDQPTRSTGAHSQTNERSLCVTDSVERRTSCTSCTNPKVGSTPGEPSVLTNHLFHRFSRPDQKLCRAPIRAGSGFWKLFSAAVFRLLVPRV